eukprot:scaffold1381_cov386-Prasinococcus_capsulatus_cf.AAC.14
MRAAAGRMASSDLTMVVGYGGDWKPWCDASATPASSGPSHGAGTRSRRVRGPAGTCSLHLASELGEVAASRGLAWPGWRARPRRPDLST